VAGINGNSAGLTSTREFDEYGKPRNTSETGSLRYGWLGQAQRAADTPSGTMLMGARVYNPGGGRFPSVDPVYGGSANNYEYTGGDPINNEDASGTFYCWKDKKNPERWYYWWGRWGGFRVRTNAWCHFSDHDISVMDLSALGTYFVAVIADLLGAYVGLILAIYRTLVGLVKELYSHVCVTKTGADAGVWVKRYYSTTWRYLNKTFGVLRPFCT
jgi:RHS repeat-associated protein